jgi:Ca-activated chloride channel family protein
MELFRFQHIEYLYSLFAIPVFIVLYFLMVLWKKRALNAFGSSDIIKQLMPATSSFKPALKFIILMLAVLFLIIGLANPQIGSKLEEVKREGIDIMIALDVSNSMLAEDLVPNRLEKAKNAISQMVDKLHGDRIGIIVFAGSAYVQLPITTDYAAAKLFLSSINTDMLPTQGTAIGSAIELAVKSYGENNVSNKAIIVITDGENHEDDALKQAQEALQKAIKVYAIGMGLPQGAPIPVYSRGQITGYKKDRDGNTVVTKLNEVMLQQLTASGGGIYVRATNTQVGLEILFSELNKMEKTEYGSKMFTDYEDRFQYFLAIALFFLILEFFISERRSKWWDKINLFGESK